MVQLIPYESAYESDTLKRISAFFGFHKALVSAEPTESTSQVEEDDDSHLILDEWLQPPNALYVILKDDVSVGFIRIKFRGSIAAWIEDIFVDEAQRGQGIASDAIAAVEAIIEKTPGYQAVCLDVAPRNDNALRLYHKLGYRDLSLITLRKEFGDSKRDKPVKLLDLDFKY